VRQSVLVADCIVHNFDRQLHHFGDFIKKARAGHEPFASGRPAHAPAVIRSFEETMERALYRGRRANGLALSADVMM
jgi:hypothetical protein